VPNIIQEKCIGCGICLKYCPMGVLSLNNGMITCDVLECVECGVCWNHEICPQKVFTAPQLEWPRVLRNAFSDPLVKHKTGVPGRGTEEMKTNDVTGRFRRGQIGLAVELGRPGCGTRFREVEKITRAFSRIRGVEFEKNNPVTELMVDIATGLLNPEVIEEKVLSAIVEIRFPFSLTGDVINALQAVTPTVNTVFSVDLISRIEPDGAIPVKELLDSLGVAVRPNTKTNLGLGRPLAEEVAE
jgi:NAD-dependent dihydropyrimidine dehydrogenase PreA subunit